MAWDKELSEEQKAAACHFGGHARLLAGPGTGKTLTLTRRVCYLIQECGVLPENIQVITFTRAAAGELRKRVASETRCEPLPNVSTLHSFALMELLRNLRLVRTLPLPLRIADDWEERNIIKEDLKKLIDLHRIEEITELLRQLSSGWQSLAINEDGWEESLLNSKFMKIWYQHRKIYGYTLRSELVYQLRKILEEQEMFSFRSSIEHLLVDEYQDLNRCDLDVIQYIANSGAEVYIAGDDDQSIYGFRNAHPSGIRNFTNEYDEVSKFELNICRRCAKDILDISLAVLRDQPDRMEKTTKCPEDKEAGEVKILRFHDQEKEALGVAKICYALINFAKINPSDILILLRSDSGGAFSKPIYEHLELFGIPVQKDESGVKDLNFQMFLCFMRLLLESDDNLSWRVLIEKRNNNAGAGSIDAVYKFACDNGYTFVQALKTIFFRYEAIDTKYNQRIIGAISDILSYLKKIEDLFEIKVFESSDQLFEKIYSTLELLYDENAADSILARVKIVADAYKPRSVSELVRLLESEASEIEAVISEDKVNLLTMHKAKGLDAEVVIIVAADDEYIPGKAEGDNFFEQGRLLYVSLTRARSRLYITHCKRRSGNQAKHGRANDDIRSLSSFFAGSRYASINGQHFVNRLEVPNDSQRV